MKPNITVTDPRSGPDERADSNPFLANVPSVPSPKEALALINTASSPDLPAGSSIYETVDHRVAHVFIGTESHADVLATVSTQIHAFYRNCDPRTSEYRNRAISANLLLHHTAARERRHASLASGFAFKGRPRGILCAAPVRMGRRSFAAIVESQIGNKTEEVKVPGPNGITEYTQRPALRMLWPLEPDMFGLWEAFARAFDAAVGTTYAEVRCHDTAFRERDVLPWMCALAFAVNLGVLIVERIDLQGKSPVSAKRGWNLLAEFTSATSIPILCLATPASVVLSLSSLPSSAADLSAAGLIEIEPCRTEGDSHWVSICIILFRNTLGTLGAVEMPTWFPSTAYALTLGYPGLLAKALTSVVYRCLALGVQAVTPEMFLRYGAEAIAADSPHLFAINATRLGGKLNRSELRRHADWLSIRDLGSMYSTYAPY